MNQQPPPSSQNAGPQSDARRQVVLRFPMSVPRLVYVLLGVNVVIFLYFFSLSLDDRLFFLENWAKVNAYIHDGEYYRLFTAMFLHLDVMHIFFNGLALYLFGRDVEGLFGTPRFAIIYFLGGLSGSLASLVFSEAPSAGASGAVFAVFGATMVYLYHHRRLHGPGGRRMLSRLVSLMVLNLMLGFIGSSDIGRYRIDNAAHIGGLFGGVVLAWFIAPTYRVARDADDPGKLRVVDENPFEKWALPAALYAMGLLVVTVYAVTV